MTGAEWPLAAQAAATLFMTGLIWFVQIVHYPLFASVARESFAGYEATHTRSTSWVVVPPMLVEALTAVVSVVAPPPGVPGWQVWAGIGLLALVWASTATLQVPQHRKLAGGFDPRAHRRLVSTNWIRVAGWSLRSVLVLSWLI